MQISASAGTTVLWRQRVACAAALTISLLNAPAAAPAFGQTAQAASCAVPLDGEAPQVRAVPPACGVAVMAVDAGLRRQGMLDLRIGRGSLYVRSLRLIYGTNEVRMAPQNVDIQVHRLMEEGETTEPLAVSRNGLGLMAVVVNVSPPGYGSEMPVLVLSGQPGADVPEAKPATAASLAAGEWALIGSTWAHVEHLRDGIGIGRQKGRFDQLVITSRGSDLPVQSVQVMTYNNPPFTFDLRSVLVSGTLSPVIAIDPPDFVRDVIVTYGTSAPLPRPPAIEVRGRYAENWLGRTGENRQMAGGWVMLGTVDIVASPHRTAARGPFSVRGQEGAVFKRVRFVARRGAIALGGATVATASGQQETVPVNAMLLPDVETAPFAFAAGPAAIASITLSPQLHPQSRVDATVEVWAQY